MVVRIFPIRFYRIGSAPRNKFEEAQKSVPGPGTYDIPDKSIEGPKYHLGLKTSFSSAEVAMKQVPGPGCYSPNSNAFSNFSFS